MKNQHSILTRGLRQLLLTAAALLPAACAEQAEKLGGADSDLIPVTVTVAAAQGDPATTPTSSTTPATRAGTGLYTSSFAQDDQFYAVMTGTTVDATTFKADGASTSSTWTPTVQPYVRSGATATIRGYFPWRTVDGTAAGNAGPALTAWTVSQDQTSDANYQSSDLMYAPEVNISTSGTAALTFHHRMAKIIVKVTNNIGATIQAVNLVQGYRTVNLQTPATLTPGTTLSDPIGQTTPLNVSTGAVPDGGVACLVPPQTLKKDQNLIEVKTNQGTAYFALTADQALQSGTEYTATVTLDRAAIGATTAVTDWQQVLERVDAVKQNLVFRVGNATFQMNFVKGGSVNTLGGKTIKAELSDYYMGQTEVTNALWKSVVGGTLPSAVLKGDNYPVQNITKAQALDFIAKLNAALSSQLPTGGWYFALPTELQWEHAARGGHPAILSGTYTDAYSGTGDYTKVGEYAWYSGNSAGTPQINVSSTPAYTLHPVAQLKPNELGLYDMTGSVWEMTSSTTTMSQWSSGNGDITAGRDYGLDPLTLTTGSNQLNRGGCIDNTAEATPNATTGSHVYRRWCCTIAQWSVGLRLALVRSRVSDGSRSWVFDYTGSEQTVTLGAGTYRIEAWGAQAGTGNYKSQAEQVSNPGGMGGYAQIIISPTASTTLYIHCGGKGGDGGWLYSKVNGKGGYNGGGDGGVGYAGGPNSNENDYAWGSAGGGGGATHVATASGLLTTHATDDALVLVAGGAGGTGRETGGAGGGTTGGLSLNWQPGVAWNNGTSRAGQRGYDGNRDGCSTEGSGGGGGGYRGGASRQGPFTNTAATRCVGGCGGSSWGASGTTLATTLGATGFQTTAGVRAGNGRVVITKIN